MRGRTEALVLTLFLTLGQRGWAADVPFTASKLIVVDQVAIAGRAKAVFVSKDPAITKGTGTDTAQIEATLDLFYDGSSGTFAMPPGGGWVANNDSLAKYVNISAPAGGAVKASVLKPAKLLRLVGKSLGDVPLDISAPPSGAVFATFTVSNASEVTRHCTQFGPCVHNSIAGGTGYKLVCRGNSDVDFACLGTCQPTGPRFVDLGATVLDTCTNLEWEKKDGADGDPGFGAQNAADLHDVDNLYLWAGQCTVATSLRCQPNAAAAAACATGGATGCAECGPGDGTCDVDPLGHGAITTIWDWVNQMNTAGFAGHTDWRLPTSGGNLVSPTAAAPELESLLDVSQGLCSDGIGGVCTPPACGACAAPVFSPTVPRAYWSGSPFSGNPDDAWVVWFNDFGHVAVGGLLGATSVRAVRSGA